MEARRRSRGPRPRGRRRRSRPAVLGNRSPTSRPTIWATICRPVVSAMRVGGDVVAVAHHGDRVAEREDLVEAVRDEDQGAALVAQAAGDGEQPLDLDAAEGGGRLVHDQQAGVERDGLGDLDDLLVGDREARAPGGAGRCATPSRSKRRSASAYIAARSMRRPRAERLAAHEDVLGDREVGEERRLLVDHRDAGGLGLGGGARSRRARRRAGTSPPSRRWTPATILTSVDLPAPFSPTSAWIEPASTRRLPERRATTGPNDLATSRSSSTAWCRSPVVSSGASSLD